MVSAYYEAAHLNYLDPGHLRRDSFRAWITWLIQMDPYHHHAVFNKPLLYPESNVQLLDPMTDTRFANWGIPRSCFPATANTPLRECWDRRLSVFVEKTEEKARERGLAPSDIMPAEHTNGQQQQMQQQAQEMEEYRQSQVALAREQARNGAVRQHFEFIVGREYIGQWGVKRRTQG